MLAFRLHTFTVMPSAQLKFEQAQHGFAAQTIVFDGLTVITGLNGAGKSRLLEIAAQKAYRNEDHLSKIQGERVVLNNINFLAKNLNLPESDYFGALENIRRKVASILADPSKNNREDLTGQHLDLDYFSRKSGKSREALNEIDCMLAMGVWVLPSRGATFHDEIYLYLYKVWLNSHYAMIDRQTGAQTAFGQSELQSFIGPPPWERINNLMKAIDFPYEFKVSVPNPWEVGVNGQCNLVHISGRRIKEQEFSQGEKVIFWLLVAAVSGDKYHDCLFLDEIDSVLHPSAIQYFISNLRSTFVDRLNIPVVLVTHSPTTVALAPEESIYTLLPSPDGQILRKTDRETALKELCAGLPMLSVDMVTRRIVFAESVYDSRFYERIYHALSEKIGKGFSLAFYPSGQDGRSANSTNVKALVKALSGNPARNVFGVIDYDGENSAEEFLVVLAEGQAWTLENVLLDPMLMALYLRMRQKINCIDIGLNRDVSTSDFFYLSQSEIQGIAESILKLYEIKTDPSKPPVRWEYFNGRWIDLPQELLMIRGHDLVDQISSAGRLAEMFKRNGKSSLQEEMPHVILEHSGWTPIVLVNLIKSLVY